MSDEQEFYWVRENGYDQWTIAEKTDVNTWVVIGDGQEFFRDDFAEIGDRVPTQEQFRIVRRERGEAEAENDHLAHMVRSLKEEANELSGDVTYPPQ